MLVYKKANLPCSGHNYFSDLHLYSSNRFTQNAAVNKAKINIKIKPKKPEEGPRIQTGLLQCGEGVDITVSYALRLGESFNLSPNCVYKENYCSNNQKMCKQVEVTFHYLW